jgi:hypothetical protein
VILRFCIPVALLSLVSRTPVAVAQLPCQNGSGTIVYQPAPVVVGSGGQVMTNGGQAVSTETRHTHSAATGKSADLRRDMRKLWDDHVTWTRPYIISALGDLPDKDATSKRLIQNQVDIGNAIKPFYGDDAGNKLTTLLKDHILIAVDLIDAAKADDKTKQDDATKRWQANADEIAASLSKANPQNWPEAEMKSMMREHLDLTTQEAVARLKKDWNTDVSTFEKVQNQALHMADMLSSGIAKQFPDKVAH